MSRIKAERLTLSVGIQDEEAGATAENGDGLTVGDVASINEFGLGVPERSFIRAWFDQNESQNKDTLRNVGTGLVKGAIPDATTALNQAGLSFVGSMQGRMSAGVPPPNAPSTIARKGSSTPLIDTGQLRASIRHKVTKAG